MNILVLISAAKLPLEMQRSSRHCNKDSDRHVCSLSKLCCMLTSTFCDLLMAR